MMRIGIATSLVVLWILLWGDISAANLLSGILVSTALLAAFPGDRRDDAMRYVIRPFAALRLVGWFVVQLVRSNVLLTREVLSPRSRIRTGVVACPLRTTSSRLTTIVANVIALTPGTMTVDIDSSGGDGAPPVLFVHVLKLDDVATVRRSVTDLESLVLGAFGPLPSRSQEDDRL
jgi:multicomponent Na+:H+ antiporter subunit E